MWPSVLPTIPLQPVLLQILPYLNITLTNLLKITKGVLGCLDTEKNHSNPIILEMPRNKYVDHNDQIHQHYKNPETDHHSRSKYTSLDSYPVPVHVTIHERPRRGWYFLNNSIFCYYEIHDWVCDRTLRSHANTASSSKQQRMWHYSKLIFKKAESFAVIKGWGHWLALPISSCITRLALVFDGLLTLCLEAVIIYKV